MYISRHSTGGSQTKQSITQIRPPQNPSRSPRAKAAVATSDASSSGLLSRCLPRRECPVVPQHVVVALGDGDRDALEEVLLPPLGLPAATAALLLLLLLTAPNLTAPNNRHRQRGATLHGCAVHARPHTSTAWSQCVGSSSALSTRAARACRRPQPPSCCSHPHRASRPRA